MKEKLTIYSFEIYELIIAFIAINTGMKMILDPRGKLSVFANGFSTNWTRNLNITNNYYPGLIVIVLFGIGNVLVLIYCISNKQKLSSILGISIGITLFISIILQMLYSEVVLFSFQCLIISLIQILWSIKLLNISKPN